VRSARRAGLPFPSMPRGSALPNYSSRYAPLRDSLIGWQCLALIVRQSLARLLPRAKGRP